MINTMSNSNYDSDFFSQLRKKINIKKERQDIINAGKSITNITSIKNNTKNKYQLTFEENARIFYSQLYKFIENEMSNEFEFGDEEYYDDEISIEGNKFTLDTNNVKDDVIFFENFIEYINQDHKFINIKKHFLSQVNIDINVESENCDGLILYFYATHKKNN